MDGHADPIATWLEALEARHLAELTFPEVRRAVQALSALWVGRRGRIATGAAFDGVGKRAAFALYYAPLHFLVVREVVRALGAARSAPQQIVDLGCGSGVASAAWGIETGARPSLVGIDRNAWAVAEARWNWRRLGLSGSVRVGDVDRARLGTGAIIAAFAVNELDGDARARLLARLRDAAERGARVLVVEPLARSAAPWWDRWADSFREAGGRADEWRFRADLPPLLSRFDRAAGLDHRVSGARSLWLYNAGRFPTGADPTR